MGNIIDIKEKSFEYREQLLEDNAELENFVKNHALLPAQKKLYETYLEEAKKFERLEREYKLKDSNLHFDEDKAMDYLMKYRSAERHIFSLRMDLVDSLLG